MSAFNTLRGARLVTKQAPLLDYNVIGRVNGKRVEFPTKARSIWGAVFNFKLHSGGEFIKCLPGRATHV